MLIRAAALFGCLLSCAVQAGEAPECANDMRIVRETLARDQNLADEGRHAVEQLLRDAQQALTVGDAIVCREMMEDAKELLGLDAAD